MIVALDLETTGLDKIEDSIIEVALVKFDIQTGQIVDKFSTLVNPGFPIPSVSSTITWITDNDVKDAPYISDILDDISDFIWDLPILWHNTQFDKWFLSAAWIDLSSNLMLDTFFLANIFLRNLKSLSLESICNHYNIADGSNFHRALDDAIATKDIFIKLIWEIKYLSLEKQSLINFIFSKWNDTQTKFYFDLFWLDSKLSDVDILKYFKLIIPSYKSSDLVENEEVEFREWNYFNTDNFSWLSTFEIRENQKIMWEIVGNSLSKKTKEVIEAPTWVWKTFAYMLPSILYSVKSWEKVLISTKTKALQDQICYKDIETLRSLWLEFNFVKLKWKKNYIWIWAFTSFLLDTPLFSDNDVSMLAKIALWLTETDNWELDNLNFYPFEYEILKNVDSDNILTLSDDNDFKRKEFLFKARKSIENANIVVVNHSLLIQDVKWWNQLFSDISNLIIDESHSLEDVSTDALKDTYNYDFVEDLFYRIETILKQEKQSLWYISKCREEILFDTKSILDIFLAFMSSENPWLYWQSYSNSLINSAFYSNYLENFNSIYESLSTKVSVMISNLWDLDDNIFLKISQEISKIEEFLSSLGLFLIPENSEKYILLATYSNSYWVWFSYTFLNPGLYLKENLWDKKESIILTSATLKVSDSFDYINSLLFLQDFNSTSLSSDFDYNKQALLFIPNDLGSIKNNSARVSSFLWDFLSTVKWNTMILCTSFASIKEIYLHLNSFEWTKNINILAQSFSWWKHKIIESFKQNPENSVIIWTDTFWEWVDIPWDALKYLIINKLPFSVPTDPIFKARSRLFWDAFSNYSIPKSIIKLKQWFWRLIRTKKDKWIVILLDNRVIDSRWWEKMYSAFPSSINKKIWTSSQFLEAIKNSKDS